MNSDDVLNSLMAEMGAAQGYAVDPKKAARAKPSTKRMLPELDGYPDNLRRAGTDRIWNPYVACASLPTSQPLPFLATNPHVEVMRRRAYEKFKTSMTEMLQRIQTNLKVKLPIPAMLEKWHMDCKFEEVRAYLGQRGHAQHEKHKLIDTTANIHAAFLDALQPSKANDPTVLIDPVLLQASTARVCSLAARFRQEYQRASAKDAHPNKKVSKKMQQITKGVHAIVCQALEQMEQELRNAQKTTMGKKSPKIQYDAEHQQHKVTYAGLTFAVHARHYEKLQRLFDRRKSGMDFATALFCVLCRYDMLQGAGLQAGMPGGVFDVLLTHFECQMECFASPLNCRYGNFGSVFDLDRLFGSQGSFFTHRYAAGGCYQANPPFCESVICGMCDRMDELLKEQTHHPLMFIIFVPVWKESPGYQKLVQSAHLSRHVVLDQGRHWYTEGTQYRRKASFRVASFDTSIFFFQNEPAKQKWTVTEAAVDDIRNAFQKDPHVNDKATSAARITASAAAAAVKEKEKEQPVKTSASSSAAFSSRSAVGTSIDSDRHHPASTQSKRKQSDKRAKPTKQPKGKKRKLVDGQDQLDLLSSLGLASSSNIDSSNDNDNNDNTGVKEAPTKPAGKKSKKGKRRK